MLSKPEADEKDFPRYGQVSGMRSTSGTTNTAW